MWDMNIGYGSDILTTLHYYVIGDPLTLLSVFVPAEHTETLYEFADISADLSGWDRVFQVLFFITKIPDRPYFSASLSIFLRDGRSTHP